MVVPYQEIQIKKIIFDYDIIVTSQTHTLIIFCILDNADE